MTPRTQLDIASLHVIDGGLATELEYRGADISGPLWSAHVLEEAPEKVEAVHRAYIEAGADCIATASYQVSARGYIEFGLSADQAANALRRSVQIARKAHAAFPERKVLIAASLGPYGAALHNGAEYHGNYECSFTELVSFHADRIAVLEGTEADLLAFETIPSLEEARAILEALKNWPEIAAWLSFTCRNTTEVAHGEPIRDCGALVEPVAQVVALGINCTAPGLIAPLLQELRPVSTKPLLVYPNSGEIWDARRRGWTGSSDPEAFGKMAEEWHAQGAQAVGSISGMYGKPFLPSNFYGFSTAGQNTPSGAVFAMRQYTCNRHET
jgi:homocysteine S-methyltransferase